MTRPLSPAEMFPAGHPEIESRFVTLATRTRVRVLERGPRDAALTALLLHGWVASSYTFRNELQRLPALGVRCVAADLRGFGLSDKPRGSGRYTLDAYMGDVDALLDALGIRRALFVGHSMGGGIALHYALARPERVRGLMLMSPVGLVPVAFVRLPRLLPRPIVAATGRALVPRWLASWIMRHVAYADASRATPDVVDQYWAPTQLPGFTLAASTSAAEFDWAPLDQRRLERLDMPVAVILGRHDRLIRNASEAASRLPGARVVELDAGHCPHEERPHESNEVEQALLERIRMIA